MPRLYNFSDETLKEMDGYSKEGRSNRLIAELFDVPEQTVMLRLRSYRAKLKQGLTYEDILNKQGLKRSIMENGCVRIVKELDQNRQLNFLKSKINGKGL